MTRRLSRFITVVARGPMREHPNVEDVLVLDGILPFHWGAFELAAAIPPGFTNDNPAGWDDEPFRYVWMSDAQRASITYCEGDVTIAVALSDIAWAAYKRDCANFYERPVPA